MVVGVDDPELLALLLAITAFVLATCAEWIHARRAARVAPLYFGPRGKPAAWARAAPAARVLSFTALAWGLTTLLVIEPRRYSIEKPDGVAGNDPHHVLLVLDVSPSMRLVDAGPTRKQSRMQRARDVMQSFFDRVPLSEYKVSVVAVYNGAKPVVVDTSDFEVVRNILGDLPMHFAFRSGKTKLFDGLQEAARIAQPWNPRSTTLILVSDGDTVPATGMPAMPASVRNVIVVGVGDPKAGKFIDGKQSRQDVPMLKQIAARLGGVFHNGNEFQLATALIAESFGRDEKDVFEKLTRREYALIAIALGGLILACLPLFLHFLGTRWRPGASKPAALATAEVETRGSKLGNPGRSTARPLAGVG